MANARRSSRLKEGPAKNMAEPDGDDSWESSEEDEGTNEAPARRGKSARRDQNADPNVSGARKRQRGGKAPANLSGLSLWDIVQKHANAINNAAKEWVERYRADRAEATAELLSVLVKASGCDVELTSEEVESGGVDDLVAALVQQVEQEGASDPFFARGAPRTLRAHYMALWDAAVREAANADCLFDDYLLDKATHLVTALSCSVVRPFRFAATLTASQLVSSYIKVQEALTSARETAQSQLQAEEKKRPKEGKGGALKGGAADRIAALKRSVDKMHRRVQELKTYTSNIFTGVFAHRFRDVAESIRGTVIDAIGAWIAALPSQFLSDTYLKYLAWALSDRHELVRAAAVRAVARLYDSSDNVGPLHDFTERFTPRFVELPFDVDDGVAAAGLALLRTLMEAGELAPEKVTDVYGLLNDGSLVIRRAAAALVAGLLEARGRSTLPAQEPAEAVQQSNKAARAKKAAKGAAAAAAAAGQSPGSRGAAAAHLSRADAQLLGLLDLMEQLAKSQSEDPAAAAERRTSLALTPHSGPSTSSQSALQHAPLSRASVALLVDALWDSPPLEGLLSDWGLMVKGLGDEAASEVRGDMGNAHLAALMAAAVHRASNAEAALSHKAPGARAKQGANAAAAADSERQKATLALMGALPQLLKRHQADPFVVAPLLHIIPELKLELFALKAGGSAKGGGLGALLSLVDDAFFRHGSQELQRSAAAALLHCARNGPATIQEVAQLTLKETVGTAANKLVAAAKTVQKMKDAALQDAVCDLAVAPDNAPAAIVGLLLALRRVHVLLAMGASELATHEAVESACQALLLQHVEGRELGPALMEPLLRLMQTAVLWRQHAALTAHEDDDVNAFVEARDDFVERLTALASDTGTDPDTVATRQLALTVLADTLLAGRAVSSSGEEGVGERLRLVPTQEALEALWGAVCAVLATPLPEGGAAADDWDDDDAAAEEAEQEERAAATRHAMKDRVQAVASLGRLLAFDALPDDSFLWLAARVVSLFAGHGKEVTDAVREVIRAIKKHHAPQLPAIYLGALEQAWAPVAADADDDAAQQRFGAVAARIASTYAGFNLSAPPILAIVRGGISFALHNPPSRLNYLPWGLSHFTTKLPPADAGKVAEELEQKVARIKGRPAEGADGWDGLETYMQGLKDRAACHKVTKGVLKTPGTTRAKPAAAAGAAAAGAAAGGAAGKGGGRKRNRSISFAPATRRARGRGRGGDDDGTDDDDDEEREEIEDADADDEAHDGAAGDDGAGHEQQEEEQQEEEEDEQEEEEVPAAKRGRGAAAKQPLATKARAPLAERRARMRAVDVDAGPLATPSQHTQSQSQSLRASRSQSQRSSQLNGSQPSGSQQKNGLQRQNGSRRTRGSGGSSGRGGSLRHTPSQEQEHNDEDLLASEGNDGAVELMPTEEEMPLGRNGRQRSGNRGNSSGSLGASLGELLAPAQEEEEEEDVQLDTVTQDTTIDVDQPPPKPKRRRRGI